MKHQGHLTRKEKKEIRQKRRQLRKDLKKRGIRSRQEFEIIAQQMGLVYGGVGGGLLLPFWRLAGFLGGHLGMWGAIAAPLAVLATVGTYMNLIQSKGDFTIALSGNLEEKGFQLCDTEDFANPRIRLSAEVLGEVNAASIADIPDLDTGFEGAHNIENVMAYTFWVRFPTKEQLGTESTGEEQEELQEEAYTWQFLINNITNDVDTALWMIIYDEGDATVYSKALEDGKEEHLSGYTELQFEGAGKHKYPNYTSAAGKAGVRTTAYYDEENQIVAVGSDVLKRGETHKYTVVMWIEGDDPECTNELLGGTASFMFKFTLDEENNGIFDELNGGEDDYQLENPDFFQRGN